MSRANIEVLVVNVANVPDEAETYKDLLGMNENLPENLNEKGVKVNDESMEDIEGLPELELAMMEPTPLLDFD